MCLRQRLFEIEGLLPTNRFRNRYSRWGGAAVRSPAARQSKHVTEFVDFVT